MKNKVENPSYNILKKDPLCIYMALHSFHIGGCELQLLSLSQTLRSYNIELTIVYSQTQGSHNPPSLEGVRFLMIPPIYYQLRMIPWYLRWKIGKTPHLFHCHGLSPFIEQILWYAQKKQIPTLVKVTTEGHVTELKEKIKRRSSSWKTLFLKKRSFRGKKSALEVLLFGKNRFQTYSNVNAYASISPKIFAELEAFPISKNQIFNLPNGVDCERFKPISEKKQREQKVSLGLSPEQNYIVMAARFVKRKRYSDLILAWSQLASQYPHFTLLLLGDGPEKSDCERQAATLGLSSRVIFAGIQLQIELYLQIAYLFVFTSEREGLPNVILEAMASAVPILATCIGGIEEIVDSQQNGLLFTPGDINGLVFSLRHLLDRPEEAKKWGMAAREKMLAHYSFEKIAPQFVSVYQRLARLPKDDLTGV